MPNPNKVTERLFQSPSKYIQGPYAIQNAAKYLSKLGKSPLLICDDIVWNIAGQSLVTALENSQFKVYRALFGGEASREEIDRLSLLGKDNRVDFVIALGGGKTIDTAKTVADGLAVQVAVIPTTASTDAPCSALSVLYRPSGEFHCYTFFHQNPNVVLVDTTVISRAPPRFLAAGMGDAIATNVEARRCMNSTNFGGGLQTEVSSAICQKCEEILFKYGKQAYEANKAHAVTPALEAVVEANTLLSGLGFESGGLAAAHAIHNGMTAIEELHKLLHGEKVAFGTICQLVLDGVETSELDRYIEFMLSVDLPVNFEQLGISHVTDEKLREVAELACAEGETIWNLDRVINVDFVFGAIKAADAAGRDYIQRTGWRKNL
ncbi:glycerol dehydrogenase [Lentinus tigrinus ALCF2SS1-6]|uniref:Glycerol dehydrogenase n=1 Tax=Lentinus tigrinus ALCF2SS1-6 TaxID=1328759 RepID=A0A5C2SGS2_9APHY|nr:glycerol dehydrogenase [Lentinus tigrinus ALCF2SS1-6]